MQCRALLQNTITTKHRQAMTTFESTLSTLIDDYKVRLAKIEQAANRIEIDKYDKAWKQSAAKQTKRFITDLKRLKRSITSHQNTDQP